MVDDLLRGLVDPLGTPPHGCVEYQAGILPASATGAVKALPCADVPVCSGQVHYDHVRYERARTKKNTKQPAKGQGRIQSILRMGKAGRTTNFCVKDHELFQHLLDREAKSGNTAALSNETKADVVGDQLRGSVDPSGTPLHGCVVYQDGALPAVALGVTEALSDVPSRVFEGSDPEVAMVTGVDMVDDLLRGSVDPLGTPPHGCVEYLGTAVMEVETGEIEMEGDYARADRVDIIKGKEVNMPPSAPVGTYRPLTVPWAHESISHTNLSGRDQRSSHPAPQLERIVQMPEDLWPRPERFVWEINSCALTAWTARTGTCSVSRMKYLVKRGRRYISCLARSWVSRGWNYFARLK